MLVSSRIPSRFYPAFIALGVLLVLTCAVSLASAQQGTPGDEIPLPITENIGYTVQEGDTLDIIAARFDVQIDCLAADNGLDASSVVRPGDSLLISIECPFYDGELEVIIPRDEANILPPDEDTAEEAQSTPEPTAVPDAPEAESASEDAPGVGMGMAGETYVVQPRDTLDTIAQEFNVSLVSLRAANGLLDFRGSDLRPGVELVIPTDGVPYGQFPALIAPSGDPIAVGDPLPDGETYIVQQRDTLDTIAQAYNVSEISLRQVNGLLDFDGRLLQPGVVLVIPTDGVPYGQFPALSNPANPDDESAEGDPAPNLSGEVYVLQPRDTLDQVAAEYNVLTSCLLEANGIVNSRRVYPGQEIAIPSDCPPYSGGGTGLSAVATPRGS